VCGVVLLVQNSVERDGGLSHLAIADDEFALSAADRDQCVDRFDAGMYRRVHPFAFQNARRALFERITLDL